MRIKCNAVSDLNVETFRVGKKGDESVDDEDRKSYTRGEK